ncbi:prostacyclin receptor isoform 2-T2 [Liasis olivaceus]
MLRAARPARLARPRPAPRQAGRAPPAARQRRKRRRRAPLKDCRPPPAPAAGGASGNFSEERQPDPTSAFSLGGFSLAAMFVLCAMAVERCLAISYPYFYSQHHIRRWVKLSLPAIYVFSALFCALPFLKVGKYKQYCPGTWCFVQMDKDMVLGYGVTFSLSYATVTALLIAAIFLCNGLVIFSLCQMYQKQKQRRRGSVNVGQRRRKSWFSRGEEEVDYLILLALMTVIFVICSLPLTIRAYIGGIDPDHREADDMIAFRLSALNPIVDPWLFIIFRHAVFRSVRSFFCCQVSWPCWFRLPKGTTTFGTQDSLPCQAQSVC